MQGHWVFEHTRKPSHYSRYAREERGYKKEAYARGLAKRMTPRLHQHGNAKGRGEREIAAVFSRSRQERNPRLGKTPD